MNRRIRDFVVTLFVIFGVFLGIFAYFWFSGRMGTRYKKFVTVYFPDVSGLKTGDRVEVLGITKGRIAGMKLEDKRVKVLVALSGDVLLRRDARFAVRSLSYLGSDRYLTVHPGYGEVADDTTTFSGFNEVLDLETTFLRLDRLLTAIDPEDLIQELRSMRAELFGLINQRLRGMDSGFVITSASIERMAGVVDSLTRLLNQESTARKLLTSAELYDELLKTSRQLQGLMADIKEHPENYFRLRIFR
ncbi:MAG: MlaD family protein [candidate division WOR-3 bacterium]